MTNPGFLPSSRGDQVRALIAVSAVALVVIIPLAMVAYLRANPPQATSTDNGPRMRTPKKSARASKAAEDASKPPAADPDKPMISLVLLLRQPYNPGINDVRTAAQKAFGERFGSGPQDENFVIRLDPNSYAVLLHGKRRGGARLGVMLSPGPYDEDADAFAEKCPNPNLRPLVKQHKAWLAVDFFGPLDESNRPRVYRMIGQLLAQFAGNNCLVIYATENGQFRRYDNKVPAMLSGGSPVDDFVDHVPNR
jgi:hypothetical protein